MNLHPDVECSEVVLLGIRLHSSHEGENAGSLLGTRMQALFLPHCRRRDVTDLGHVLDELAQARQSWTDAMLSLEFMEVRGTQTSPEAARLLMTEAMEQRMRLSMLLHEVEREHLLAYRGVPASHEREEEMRR